jgi:hypothetical protein
MQLLKLFKKCLKLSFLIVYEGVLISLWLYKENKLRD